MRILVVDDDGIFRTRLTKAFTARGYETHVAASGEEGIEVARRVRPQRAVVDLRMPGINGLDLVSQLHALDPQIKTLVLTGYGSIATAVEAVHRGAIDYLTKPVDTEQILASFARYTNGAGADDALPAPAEADPVPSLARVEYEHIQRILSDCHGNISAAARKLGIHRRSLQRKLSKLPPLA
jgi:two-component system, response regulator RegA